MKPIIGILPTYNLENKEKDPYLDRASFVRMYAQKIIEAGGIPIGLLEENMDMYTSICDGYLWPGGNKIYQKFNVILEDALKKKKPVLGICLGAQAIATYFNVIEDLKSSKEQTYNDVYQKNKEEHPYLIKAEDQQLHNCEVTKDPSTIEAAKHPIKLVKNSFLYEIYGQEQLNVVSLHGVVVNRIAKNILVSANSQDGVIEAVEYHEDNNNILGVQFHPEILEDSKIFTWLIEKSLEKYVLLVNKQNAIPASASFSISLYESEYPKALNDSNMEQKTLESWLKFRDYVRAHGFYIEIESAYRKTEIQRKLYNEIALEKGVSHADQFVAKPLHSEHETGLALDICQKVDNQWYIEFAKEMEDCYQFMHACCADFGFILRYPKGKESITGYHYEPWHFRYIASQQIAHEIMENNLTLEEYYENKGRTLKRSL